MTQPSKNFIKYEKPDISALKKEGYNLCDMHLHTCYSDGLPKIPDVIKYAKKKQICLSITDHNEINGVLKAVKYSKDVMVIPGIELETKEGPHILMYFYTADDLSDFFNDFNREKAKLSPALTKNLPVIRCLTLAEKYDCLRIAAHPFGYYGINRGILKCVDKNMLPGVMNHIDGVEAICGGMIRGLNQKSMNYARMNKIPFTGGSDAHILSEVGNVLTGTFGETVEEFLSEIAKRKNIVIGKSGNCLNKGKTAGVIAWSFVPYTKTFLSAHYSMNKQKVNKIFRPDEK
jgi:hypothetical protein